MQELKKSDTPRYVYDLGILDRTLRSIKEAIAGDPSIRVHYAIKANANPIVLSPILSTGLGIDAVSGGEIERALQVGFAPADIVYAGVGKTDQEIDYALNCGIGCFNVESIPELENISQIATRLGKGANVAIRVNPDIDAHTHHYITTGLNENKFGIDLSQLDAVISMAKSLPSIRLAGLHFHIGSQITITEPFRLLCDKINEIQAYYNSRGIFFDSINVGGGLGIDYDNPDALPDFKEYFATFQKHLQLRPGQQLHFELGRAVVGQCGFLLTKVLYVKEGVNKKFAIVDAGMTELIRPALYQAHHAIRNVSNPDGPTERYDVVGPVCESSDVFATDEPLPQLRRGDILEICSAGAYGETMASTYNLRSLPASTSR